MFNCRRSVLDWCRVPIEFHFAISVYTYPLISPSERSICVQTDLLEDMYIGWKETFLNVLLVP